METKLIVTGMTCQNCANHVRHALEKVPGVTSAIVDLAAGSAIVKHGNVDQEALITAVEQAGYSALRQA